MGSEVLIVGLAPGLMRGLHLAALSLLAGGLVVALLAGKGVFPVRARRFWLVLAIVSGLGWLLIQARQTAGGAFPAADWLLLSQTGFGRAMGLRLALLLIAALLPGRALVAVLPAILLQPLFGHGAAMPVWQALAGGLHALAGLVWAGAVLRLWLISQSDPGAALLAARRFSPLGVGLVLFLGLGIWGQVALIGGIAGLFGTVYGQILLAKAALLLVMLVCAALNGIWLAHDGHIRALRISLGVEAVAGGLVVLLAGVLAMQVPGQHAAVVWPFPLRPVPDLWQDAFLLDRLLRMVLPVLLAAALIFAGLIALRRSRPLALVALLLAGVPLWQMPVFPAAPFLRPAVPSSFQIPDQRRNTVTPLAGARLFARDCAGCHNPDAKGAGPLASGDPVWPPDLTSGYFLATTNGDWFWRIGHGMVLADGRQSMPANPALTDREIWQIIDFLRANASAQSIDAKGVWRLPTPAPALVLRCGERRIDLSRPPGGRLLYLGRGAAQPDLLQIDPAECAPLDDAARATLSLLAGRAWTDDSTLLVDGRGYLRQSWAAPAPPDSLDAALQAAQSPVTDGQFHH